MSKINMIFDRDVAKKVGTDAAIILSNIEYWQSKNKANNRNYHDGNYWTYNSVSAWCELFDYLTKSQIRRCLEKLEKEKYVIVGNYNKSNYDRTKWYCAISQVHLSEITNPNVINNKPIPYINTDDKPNDKPLPKKTEIVFSEEVFNCYYNCLKYFPEQLYPTNKNSWLDTIDKLNRIDKVPFNEIERLTRLAREDYFWESNFLSINKLRQKNPNDIKYIVVFSEKFKQKKQDYDTTAIREFYPDL